MKSVKYLFLALTILLFNSQSFAQNRRDGSDKAALVENFKRKPDGGWRLNKKVSDDELRAFIEGAKRGASKAGSAKSREQGRQIRSHPTHQLHP